MEEVKQAVKEEVKKDNQANCFIRCTQSSKTGKKYVYLVVTYGDGFEKRLFIEEKDICEFLDCSPRGLQSLEPSDYPIK